MLCCAGLLCAAFLGMGMLAPHSAHAIDSQILFSHYADKEELSSVLSDFARSQHLNASFTAGVTGVVSGRFTDIDPKQFLEGMRGAFGVRWYQQGANIYFYVESEVVRAFLSPRIMSAAQLQDKLRASSVLSAQLPLELVGTDMLVISGPPGYVDQIRSAVAAFEEAQTNNTVMRVFPLKNAWAEDIVVNSMNTSVTIPGIASILRSMVTGQALSGSTVTQMPAVQQSLAGQGLASVGQQAPGASAAAGAAPGAATGGAEKQEAPAVNIIADPRVNAVLITDAIYRMAYYERVIEDLDKPVALVEIHAAIVDIDTNFQRDLGINFQGRGSVGDNVGGGVDSSTKAGKSGVVPAAGDFLGQGLTLSTIYTHGTDFFLARVQALEQVGSARMLGRPSVLTMDNIQATLENITTYYVPVSSNTNNNNVADLFKVDSGTILKVTPHIIEATGEPNAPLRDSIKLVVSVQDDQNDNTGSANIGALPPIKQTKINTQAVVDEGQSLLIGGYYYERRDDTVKGVPGLMNIPILGHLFKTTNKTSKRMERLVLITPRIVRLDNLPKPPTRVDDARMYRTATQSDYEEAIPVVERKGAGCSRQPAPMPPARSENPAPAVTPVTVSPVSPSPSASASTNISPAGVSVRAFNSSGQPL